MPYDNRDNFRVCKLLDFTDYQGVQLCVPELPEYKDFVWLHSAAQIENGLYH